jgi:hypothetical protein
MKFRKPRKLPKSERAATSLHLKIVNYLSRPTAIERDAYLRKAMALPRLGKTIAAALAKARQFDEVAE